MAKIPKSRDDQELLSTIMDRFKAAWQHKEDLGVHAEWANCQDYWEGKVNLPENDDDPGSETNIVKPIIESQVADLVNGDHDIFLEGTGPSDEPFAKDTEKVLRWIWNHNDMLTKLDESERTRLTLGDVGWAVYYDPEGLNNRGLITMDPVDPAELYPDPKITSYRRLNRGDFFIRTIEMTCSEGRRRWPHKADEIRPDGFGSQYSSRVYNNEAKDDGGNEVIRDWFTVYEYWARDEDGKLFRVYASREVILEHSDDDQELHGESGDRKSFYEHNRYPYVLIPCYRRRQRLWGQGDVYDLISPQDVINDLDDQIIMNARLTGNNQTVVGKGSGINILKWTATPGLKIPASDPSAWKQVIPASIPAFIPIRRERGFYETEIISGRSDVVEGRRSGSLRAAQAVLAVQEAGNRRANHKKLMLQSGFNQVLELVLEYMKEFMTTEEAFKITENEKTDYLWFRGSDLKSVPWLRRNPHYRPPGENEEDTGEKLIPLVDSETNEAVVKEAEFDLKVSLGAGLPNNKAFLYQATIELAREGLITQEEARTVLKRMISFPVIDPNNPVGTFSGRNLPPEQFQYLNGIPSDQGSPPDMGAGNMIATPSGVNGAQGMGPGSFDLSQFPPEMQMLFMSILQESGGAQNAYPQT